MVEAIEENHENQTFKQAIDLVLDTLGLPPCDDISEAREMIREAIKNDRRVQNNIE